MDKFYKPDDDFSIDRFHLDLEEERNSHMMRKYGKQLATVSIMVREAKKKIKCNSY